MPKERFKPFAKKDNYWSKQRVEKGLKLKEVAELLELNEKIVAAYFSGFLMPADATITALCDLFGVDYNTGKLEFQHAHRQWKAEHNNGAVYKTPRRKPEKVFRRIVSSDKPETIAGESKINNAEDILTAVYSVVSCGEFIDIYNAVLGHSSDDVNIPAILYGKIKDYETYQKIIEMIGSTQGGVIQ